PEVLVLDEPTAGMDPEGRAATRAIVADLRASGVAILLTSHDLGDVERMADRVVVLRAGTIVATGTPAELAAGVQPRLRFRLERALTLDQEAELGRRLSIVGPGVTVVADADAGRYRVEGAAPDPAVIAALAGWCAEAGRLLVEVQAVGGTLEEAYLELVGDGTR
ncbi:MAG: ABC transporter ATP-binding protein, partial [Chloroflexota bacterium]